MIESSSDDFRDWKSVSSCSDYPSLTRGIFFDAFLWFAFLESLYAFSTIARKRCARSVNFGMEDDIHCKQFTNCETSAAVFGMLRFLGPLHFEDQLDTSLGQYSAAPFDLRSKELRFFRGDF